MIRDDGAEAFPVVGKRDPGVATGPPIANLTRRNFNVHLLIGKCLARKWRDGCLIRRNVSLLHLKPMEKEHERARPAWWDTKGQ